MNNWEKCAEHKECLQTRDIFSELSTQVSFEDVLMNSTYIPGPLLKRNSTKEFSE